METHSGTNIRVGKVGSGIMEAVKNFAGLAADSREVKPGYLFAALPGTNTDGSKYIADENPRLRLARLAAKFFAAQPKTVAAVTGTNGKTSVSVFLRQIWERLGRKTASLGTIGAISPSMQVKLRQTTPDPIGLHKLLAELKHDGIDWLALEASSHGLDQYRLDGTDIAACGFTNITRDHLDYHESFEEYLATKLRLFAEVVRNDGVAVVNADAAHSGDFIAAAQQRHLKLVTVGAKGKTIKLVSLAPHGEGQKLVVSYAGKSCDIELPLAGEFQASNALVATGFAIGLGDPADKVFEALKHLEGAPGRLEKVAYAKSGAAIYVDYAHTPDALQTVLTAIRPHVKNKLHVVFGCGGDRDKGKRPLMGKAACEFADDVIVTDDNPRSENPAQIRKEALAGCPRAKEIGDRAEAIHAGTAALGSGDALVIAGKGHESGQIVGLETRPFLDKDEAVKAAVVLGGRAA